MIASGLGPGRLVNDGSFYARFKQIGDDVSPFCIGLDPSAAAMASARLTDDVAGLRAYCETIVYAASDYSGIIKPQVAYFERFGPDGYRELQRIVSLARELGFMVILDGKRGDIAETCKGYSQAYFGKNSPFSSDAITVNPFMGFGSLSPLFDAAADNGAHVFVVVMSSNLEGRALQNARIEENGKTVSEDLVDKIVGYNNEKNSYVVGAVLGANIGDTSQQLIGRLNGELILAPGIGYQGGEFNKLSNSFKNVRKAIIPIMARGITSSGFSHNILRSKISEASEMASLFRLGQL